MITARPRIVPVIAFAGAVLGFGAGPDQDQVALRYQFKVGDTFRYEAEQKTSITGSKVAMETTNRFAMVWRVVEVDGEGKARIAQKFDHIRMVMDGKFGKVDYDSKTKPEPEGEAGKALGVVLNALAGSEVRVTMDARGAISDVTLPEKLAQTLKAVAGTAPGLADMLSPEGLKRMQGGGLILPAQPVKVGATWTQKLDNKSPAGTMKVVHTMTYEGTVTMDGKALQKIAVKPDVTLEPAPDAPTKLQLKTTDAKGSALFDNAAGRLVELNMTQHLQVEVHREGQDSTQSVRTTTLLKLKS